jgi:predicted PhzF superfamily epimerase YddE/YHI9
MGLELTVVDAFTERPFAGNPAAVAIVPEFPDGNSMQAVAREMNLSETAFVVSRADGDYDLRWFTPVAEVALCGHATLASAHVVGSPARFHTRSGVLSCTAAADGSIEMDFPSDPPTPVEMDPAALGLEGVRWCGQTRDDLLVELAGAAAVRSFVPDLSRLAAAGTRGVIVTGAGDVPGIDCVSRFFAPNLGIPEDPVTGSAHCALAVFWAERTGKHRLLGEQASSRGGLVRMTHQGDRVVLGGHAVAISRVRLLVEPPAPPAAHRA